LRSENVHFVKFIASFNTIPESLPPKVPYPVSGLETKEVPELMFDRTTA
jgi:hypothetical protein